MGPVDALYDTNIIIDALKHIPAAETELRRNPPNQISVVTWIEVMAGAHIDDLTTTRTLLSNCIVLPLTGPIAERAATLRRATKLKLPDAIILATAQLHALMLLADPATRNTRDFLAGTDIHIPYTL